MVVAVLAIVLVASVVYLQTSTDPNDPRIGDELWAIEGISGYTKGVGIDTPKIIWLDDGTAIVCNKSTIMAVDDRGAIKWTYQNLLQNQYIWWCFLGLEEHLDLGIVRTNINGVYLLEMIQLDNEGQVRWNISMGTPHLIRNMIQYADGTIWLMGWTDSEYCIYELLDDGSISLLSHDDRLMFVQPGIDGRGYGSWYNDGISTLLIVNSKAQVLFEMEIEEFGGGTYFLCADDDGRSYWSSRLMVDTISGIAYDHTVVVLFSLDGSGSDRLNITTIEGYPDGSIWYDLVALSDNGVLVIVHSYPWEDHSVEETELHYMLRIDDNGALMWNRSLSRSDVEIAKNFGDRVLVMNNTGIAVLDASGIYVWTLPANYPVDVVEGPGMITLIEGYDSINITTYRYR